MRWVAFYSKSGSEITSLSKQPDLIITDNPNGKLGTFKAKYLYEDLREDDIVTLHGWMRIIPKSVCDKFTIYNGHPGLITKFPELKGKDPQIRAMNYTTIGSVIHRVTDVIDGGEILYSAETENKPNTDIFQTLKQTSLTTWEQFIEERIHG